MSIESEIFKRYTPDYKRLCGYGFLKTKTGYEFEKQFMNGDFTAKIMISNKSEVFGKVYDAENGEEFLPLRIENSEGAFVGDVRCEYEKLLIQIRENCFCENYFISPQANRISELIYKQFNDSPVFMWEKYPTIGVFKNPETDKWYGIIMYIPRSKLGQNSQEPVEVLNIKLNKDKIPELLLKDGFFPAYHMNKKYWISVVLDETLADDVVLSYIKESHAFTLPKKRCK